MDEDDSASAKNDPSLPDCGQERLFFIIYFFLFWQHHGRLVRSQFPRQGLNHGPRQ